MLLSFTNSQLDTVLRAEVDHSCRDRMNALLLKLANFMGFLSNK